MARREEKRWKGRKERGRRKEVEGREGGGSGRTVKATLFAMETAPLIEYRSCRS